MDGRSGLFQNAQIVSLSLAIHVENKGSENRRMRQRKGEIQTSVPEKVEEKTSETEKGRDTDE